MPTALPSRISSRIIRFRIQPLCDEQLTAMHTIRDATQLEEQEPLLPINNVSTRRVRLTVIIRFHLSLSDVPAATASLAERFSCEYNGIGTPLDTRCCEPTASFEAETRTGTAIRQQLDDVHHRSRLACGAVLAGAFGRHDWYGWCPYRVQGIHFAYQRRRFRDTFVHRSGPKNHRAVRRCHRPAEGDAVQHHCAS